MSEELRFQRLEAPRIDHVFGRLRLPSDLNVRESGLYPAMAHVDKTYGRPMGSQVRPLLRVLDARRLLAQESASGARRALATMALPVMAAAPRG